MYIDVLIKFCSCGFAIESAEDITISDQTGKKRTLSCGTEKGKHQSKNHRTAGK